MNYFPVYLRRLLEGLPELEAKSLGLAGLVENKRPFGAILNLTSKEDPSLRLNRQIR